MGAILLAYSGEIVCVSPQCEVTTWCFDVSAKAFRPSGEPFSASPPDRAKGPQAAAACILPAASVVQHWVLGMRVPTLAMRCGTTYYIGVLDLEAREFHLRGRAASIPPKLSQKLILCHPQKPCCIDGPGAGQASLLTIWACSSRGSTPLAPLEQEHVVHMIAAAFDGDESDASRVAGRFKASPAVLGSFSWTRDPSSTVWLAILLRRRPDEGGVGEGAPPATLDLAIRIGWCRALEARKWRRKRRQRRW